MAVAGRKYGPEYIIPVPFDPRLMTAVPIAVAEAAMETGVGLAVADFVDMAAYKAQLTGPSEPGMACCRASSSAFRRTSRSLKFKRGRGGARHPRRPGASSTRAWARPSRPAARTGRATAMGAGIDLKDGIEIANARLSKRNTDYANQLYERPQRKGYLLRDCQRLINQDRNAFGAAMVDMPAMRRHGDRRHPQLFLRPGGCAPGHRP